MVSPSATAAFRAEPRLQKPLVSYLPPLLEMTFTTTNSGFSLLPASPASLNAFGVFTHAQSPRDNHIVYEEFRQVLGSTNGRPAQKKRSSSSLTGLTGGLKKVFGSI